MTSGLERLRDQVVLITGASSGIGRAAALRLAELGARTALAARSASALEEVKIACGQRGGQALVLPTDVTDPGQCQAAVEQTVASFGRLDILICCAGQSMRAYIENSDLSAMRDVMSVNFFGTLYATRYAIPHIIKSRGSLVALSSLTGLRGVPSYSLYGASKFAVQGLYDGLRLELRRHGVHVGVLAPGFVDTPLRRNVLGPDGKPWKDPPDPPFRIWPVEKCVDLLIKLIVRRRSQINLPRFMGPLFWLDRIVLGKIGDWIMLWKFPPL